LIFSVGSPASGQSQEGRVLYRFDSLSAASFPDDVADFPDDFPELTGVTIDVFWCSGDKLTEDRKISASEFASSIATYARIQEKSLSEVGAFYVRSVRLREIGIGSEIAPYGVSDRNTVIVSSVSMESLRFSEVLADVSGRVFERIDSAQSSPGYLQYFICSDVNLEGAPPRVFVQVAVASQTDSAVRASEALKASFDNLRVAAGIEVVGKKAPPKTQVRYFFEEQATLAKGIADAVSKVLATEVQDVFLPTYASKGTRGVVEVWIGADYAPQSSVDYVICQGQFSERCPPGSEWIPCGTPLQEWAQATKKCSSAVFNQVTATGGNQCGYDVMRLTCISSETEKLK
jgi:hypothetical protein